ncbi:hypothetical protein A3C91_00565 [Candidatus Azambacteria bacterium RIFCSPHIGHO2_02_FULL_52_12]|uniref:Uncharacterized protein n=1 Tax=Candidatus Azambacteria bacterium RIFCSPLOWO2_01_FULL_46_25 TaxID=1797298 RepID=A0A1F5BTP8_9BACT|nr:MAG: hypothetical protein A3C91_00565 [Candidatus Azambacteria bacterium RIFCSPHIGHO2_02_FULL_52_12]OGD33956.1 MAG: hypothetical protein A2988_00485 [Candidatus Azambacteria bacterium RIFCSPLOWO2_01_FULL_46_25]OGD37642.1 MAG: hypothetical protein A2850_04560 [Candidatus Azambacteria bacterium RIFCSPHIGHO2_01_FULL_51_74]
MANKKEFFEKLILIIVGLLAVVIAAFVFGWVGSFFAPKETTNQKIEEIKDDIKKLKEEVAISDYRKKETLHKFVLVSDFNNSTKNEKPTETFKKEIKVNGKLAFGYLYARASVNNKILSVYDSVYIKLTAILGGSYKEFGGHLRRDKSLDVQKLENSTELLYKLDSVFYKEKIPYREDVEALSVDFLRVLNSEEQQHIIAFTSTLGEGTIHELSIYYECREGDNCSISN